MGSRYIKFSHLNWPLCTAAMLRLIHHRSPVPPSSLETTPVGKGSGYEERNLVNSWLTGGSSLPGKSRRSGGPLTASGRPSKHSAERFASSSYPSLSGKQ